MGPPLALSLALAPFLALPLPLALLGPHGTHLGAVTGVEANGALVGVIPRARERTVSGLKLNAQHTTATVSAVGAVLIEFINPIIGA